MRRPLAVAAVVFSLAAAAFAATDGARLAPLHLGATDVNERAIGAIPNGNTFAAITLRSAPIPGAPAQIRHTPIDANGRPLVAQARALVSSPDLLLARLSAPGNGATLAWYDGDNLTVASLSANGDLGAPHIVGHGRTYLNLGCNESRCIVEWYDVATKTETAAITDRAGNVLVNPFPLASFYYFTASDPAGFLLVGYNRLTRIDAASGTATFDVTIQQNAFIHSADFDGQDYAIVWGHYDGQYRLDSAKVNLNGAVSSVKNVLSTTFPVTSAQLAWNGSEHLLAFSTDDVDAPGIGGIPELLFPSNISVQRFSPALDAVGAKLKVTDNAEANQVRDVVWSGGRYYVSYDDLRTDTYFGVPASARGALISLQPAVLANDVIAIGPMSQRTPALASNGDVRFGAWLETDRTDNTAHLRGVRIRRDGSRIDETSREIASLKGIALARSHAAAAIGGDFLLVWREPAPEDGQAVAGRIDANGAVHRIVLPFERTFSAPKVVANGSSWLVVSLSVTQQLFAVRISRSGQILTPQPMILGAATDFDVASDGDRFAVLRGVSVSRFLTILNDDGSVVAANVTAATGGQLGLGGGHGGFLVFSGDDRARFFDRDGHASAASVRVGPRGSVTAIEPLGTGWLIWFTNENDTLVQVDANVTTAADIPNVQDLEAIAANDDGTVAALFSTAEELPPNGYGVALVMRDLAPSIPPRRRAAR